MGVCQGACGTQCLSVRERLSVRPWAVLWACEAQYVSVYVRDREREQRTDCICESGD